MRCKMSEIKELVNELYIYIFFIIGKEINQTLVSDADREISTIGSMKRLTSFPVLIICPRVGITWSASETDGKFYLSSSKQKASKVVIPYRKVQKYPIHAI